MRQKRSKVCNRASVNKRMSEGKRGFPRHLRDQIEGFDKYGGVIMKVSGNGVYGDSRVVESEERRIENNARQVERVSRHRESAMREIGYRVYVDYLHSGLDEGYLGEIARKHGITEEAVRGYIHRCGRSRALGLQKLSEGLRLMKAEELLSDTSAARAEYARQLRELGEESRMVLVEQTSGVEGEVSKYRLSGELRRGLMRDIVQLRLQEQEGLTGYLGKPVQRVELEVNEVMGRSYESIRAEIEALESKRVSAEDRVRVMDGGV